MLYKFFIFLSKKHIEKSYSSEYNEIFNKIELCLKVWLISEMIYFDASSLLLSSPTGTQTVISRRAQFLGFEIFEKRSTKKSSEIFLILQFGFFWKGIQIHPDSMDFLY